MTQDLRSAAKKIQEKGRAGDTVLAHISPHEAEMLKMMGGYGSTNPETGLPEYKKFWKNITAKNVVTAAVVVTVAIVAPEILPDIGAALGAAAGSTEAAALGGAVVGGTQAAIQGQDPLKGALAGAVGGVTGDIVGTQTADLGPTVSGALKGATSSAAGSAVAGGDPLAAAERGAITGGITGAYKGENPPAYGGGITPGAAGETGLTVPKGFDSSQLGVSTDTSTPLLGGGIDFSAPSATTSESTFKPSTIEKLGEQAVSTLAKQAASELVPSNRGQTSTLASTRLFEPTSIVPTAATGIAPTERTGAPILGDSDEEEKSGAWGRKTLKG